MALRQMLLRYGVELLKFDIIWWPPPQYNWIRRIEFLSHRWNALQAWVFIKATCNFDDGLPCEVFITGCHEFLRAGNSTHEGRVFM